MLIGQDVLRAGRALQVFASALDRELFPSSAGSINHRWWSGSSFPKYIIGMIRDISHLIISHLILLSLNI
jgi:hypothetical protein